MSKILVCGSIAYDNLLEFPGVFQDFFMNEEKDNLNVSFLVDKYDKRRGGTAVNISYNLALIGEKPYIVGSVGNDFSSFKKWLNKNGVDTTYIQTVEDDLTANCFITTDRKCNQLTSFYQGAMRKDSDINLKEIDKEEISMAVIAPTSPEAMVKWTEECISLDIPYMYDPGMQIPRLNKSDLTKGILNSKISIFNDYEFKMMKKITSLDLSEILSKLELLIVTNGKDGSVIYSKKQEVYIKSARAIRVLDPTGAGDAYRAGAIKMYLNNESIEKIGNYASVTAVYAVENKGGTNHIYTMDDLDKRYKENFESVLV